MWRCLAVNCTVSGRALTVTQAKLHAEFAKHPVGLIPSPVGGASRGH